MSLADGSLDSRKFPRFLLNSHCVVESVVMVKV